MLVKELYSVHELDITAGIKAVLHINAEHEIFKGHFPEISVLPGVCMIQIIKELIENEYNVRTRLEEADMIKFLSMMNPKENNELHVDIQIKEHTNESLLYMASIKNAGAVILKYSGRLHIN